MQLIALALLALTLGLFPAAVAQSKGRSFVAWWAYGAALFIIALPHALMLPKPGPASLWDVPEDSGKSLLTFEDARRLVAARFGVNARIRVVRGQPRNKIIELKREDLSVVVLGRGEEWREAFNEAVARQGAGPQ